MMTMWETVLGSNCQRRHWLHLIFFVDGWRELRWFGVSLVQRLAEDEDEDKDKEQD